MAGPALLESFILDKLAFGGARPNQFQVSIGGTGANVADALAGNTGKANFRFLCRAAQIPAMNVGEVLVPYRGRQLYLAGDRTFDAWTVTVINDARFSVRKMFETWVNMVGENITNIGATVPSAYLGNATIEQLTRNGTVLRRYRLEHCFPTTVDAIDLSYDDNDRIEEFGVTLRYSWMTPIPAGGTPSETGEGTTGIPAAP